MDEAVKTAFISRITNCGQICFSPKRFIICGNYHYDLFKKKLTEYAQSVRYGDPLDPTT